MEKKMNCIIRLATKSDVPAILEIYAPYVRNTAVSFEFDVPEIEEYNQRFLKFSKRFPWFVCEIDGQLAGYAYAHQYAERQAYSWSAECSIYIDSQYHGRKIGRALYACLIKALEMQGFKSAVGIVTLPNEKSERLHAAFGFERVAALKNIGYKLGEWRDVAYFSKKIGDYESNPTLPKSIWQISDTPEFQALLQDAASLVQEG